MKLLVVGEMNRVREELRVRDGKGGLLPFRGLEYFGLSIQKITEWRSQAENSGRPSSLEDFYGSHGLCFDCGSTGVRDAGWSDPSEAERPAANERGLEQLPLYVVCPTCGGTGRADRSTWQTHLGE